MMRDTLATLATLVMMFVIGAGVAECVEGCISPAMYADALSACVDASETADEWSACCARAAVKYGRNPAFCGGPDAGR